eukprot:gnl/TRDRNA2_/TRDRNA2_186198_c0_seq1.p1 gnl/TRDRNA2_/TRDRNA2_186198_c0~~gnl/TRDRNA2_/TRDRNA2_186198_c0_seq1.p1  ORF type:complete len:378 (+),score=73.17 gnl/TRDRNA2_/TRDRNA2_186198_c0_seq1:143-1276(+)
MSLAPLRHRKTLKKASGKWVRPDQAAEEEKVDDKTQGRSSLLPAIPPAQIAADRTGTAVRGQLTARALEIAGPEQHALPAATPRTPSGAPRRLHSTRRAKQQRALPALSQMGTRANARADEAHGIFLAHAGVMPGEDEDDDLAHIDAEERAAQTKAFERALEGVQAALNPATVRILRRDEDVPDSLNLMEQKHYKVPLPRHPTMVTLHVTRTTGQLPTLYASTTEQKPSVTQNEFNSKEGKIVYPHAFISTGEDGDSEKHLEAPPCRDLHVVTEAERGPCQYRIHLTFGHVNEEKILQSQSGTKHMKIKKSGWQARLTELRREFGNGEEFDEYMEQLAARQKKKEKKKPDKDRKHRRSARESGRSARESIELEEQQE